jgi:hypothetical protein
MNRTLESAADPRMPEHPKQRVESSPGYQGVERRQNERRRELRFPFVATVEAVEPKSSAKIQGRTSDISAGGCYVDTISPFSAGTVISIRMTKGAVTFDANAKVVISQVGMGMGVAFTSIVPQQMRIFQKWLDELRGESPREHAASPAEALPDQTVPRENSTAEAQPVLADLLHVLMKKGVLSEDEGKAMLRKLHASIANM